MGWLDNALANLPSQIEEIRPVPTPVVGRTLLVDGDYLAYYAAGNDDTDAGRARQNAREKLQAFKTFTGATQVVIHLTASTSNKGQRFAVARAKLYQGQRVGNRKPKNWIHLRQWLETYSGNEFKTKLWYNREADDGMAYHAAVLGDDLAVIATADKDMRMFAGLHVDWHDYHITHVGPKAFKVVDQIGGKTFGHAWFWQQMLQGDTADNIPGLPFYVDDRGRNKRVGEKTAEKLLARAHNNEEAYQIVSDLYAGYYDHAWAEEFAEQAILLWMREDQRADLRDFLRVCPQDEELLAGVQVVEDRLESQRLELERIEHGTGRTTVHT